MPTLAESMCTWQNLDLSLDKVFVVGEEYEKQIVEKWKLCKKRTPVHIASEANENTIDEILGYAAGQWLEENPNFQLKMGILLGMQIPEDLMIIRNDKDNPVVYLHTSFPNGWDPIQKIGRSVSELDPTIGTFVKRITEESLYTRFIWNLTTCSNLDRLDSKEAWETTHPAQVVFRAEHQTLWCFPQYQSTLLTTYTFRSYLGSLLHPFRFFIASVVERNKNLSSKTTSELCRWLRTNLD